MNLKTKKLFLLDMDGTIYLENKLFPKVLEFFKLLNTSNKKYVFITNNSTHSVESYVDKLTKLGLVVDEDNFYTSLMQTREFLLENHLNSRIYAVGTQSMNDALRRSKLNIVTDLSQKIDCVVVGFDRELNYEKLEIASKALLRGADFIATNCDMVCPVENKEYIPDCGAIVQLLETVTRKKAYFLGKPSAFVVEKQREKYQVSLAETVVIGDRLSTDIACGINANVDTIAVLTGETTEDEINRSHISPTAVYQNIQALYEALL